MSGHTQDGHVWAVRKVDGRKFRLPPHLIDMSPGLDYAPSEKNRRHRLVRAQEPEQSILNQAEDNHPDTETTDTEEPQP